MPKKRLTALKGKLRISPFFKDALRELWNTKGRYISLIIIIMLGTASVVGIQASAINMRDAAEKSYKASRLYDIQLKSSTGFSDEDVLSIYEMHGVANVMPTYIFDVYIDVRNELRPIRTYALPDSQNIVELISGRFPENAGECVVERRVLREARLSVGDTISFTLDNMDAYHGALEQADFIITGVVESPLYITFERGRTSLGNGTLRYYAYLHPEAYKLGVYTDIYVLMEESSHIHNVSDEYKANANIWKAAFEAVYPEWFVLTRENGTAFESYYQDTLRLQSVGYVFPMVFFIVAVLVSLTSMTRLVEEHRTQIGIYKALGYKPAAIMMKYVSYSLLCSILGAMLGVVLGSNLFPLIIGDAYGHLYRIPTMETPIPIGVAAFAVAVSASLLTSVTLITCAGTMIGEPAVLMRPKTPKAGKRVFLERVAPIWRRMGFIGKVSVRNIFRYKRRFMMTLVGVAGCAALLITAFGLRDSIGSVAIVQYRDIEKYDALVYTSEINTPAQREDIIALTPDTRLFIREESVSVGLADEPGGTTASLIIPEDFGALLDFITFLDPYTGKRVIPDSGGAVITEKLSRTFGIALGDIFSLTLPGGESYSATAVGIVENYIMHYVYFPPQYYAEVFGRDPLPNALFIAGDIDAGELMKSINVRAVIETASLINNISDSTDALGVVTVLLLVMACALAFVVLFNLTLINITERKRELATIKVLGFQDKETAIYIYREIFIITLMGTVLGLLCGIGLTAFVLRSVEIDILKFPLILRPVSFLFSAGISVFFAIFVNFATYSRLAAIDMVESLKDVE